MTNDLICLIQLAWSIKRQALTLTQTFSSLAWSSQIINEHYRYIVNYWFVRLCIGIRLAFDLWFFYDSIAKPFKHNHRARNNVTCQSIYIYCQQRLYNICIHWSPHRSSTYFFLVLIQYVNRFMSFSFFLSFFFLPNDH